jgi:hypothetical protein
LLITRLVLFGKFFSKVNFDNAATKLCDDIGASAECYPFDIGPKLFLAAFFISP